MNVLVSGARGALGSAVTDVLLGTGYTVTGVGRRATTAARDRFHWLSSDLSSSAAAAALISDALSLTGSLDAVVHTVGGFAADGPVQATTDATWDTMLQQNLNSAFYLFRAVLPHFIERRQGRLLAIGTRTVAQPAPGLSAYTVSKSALHALVRTLALELKGTGVTANIVMPSVIDTAANRQAMPAAHFETWVKPEAIAKCLLWLASAESAEISGAEIPIYGNA